MSISSCTKEISTQNEFDLHVNTMFNANSKYHLNDIELELETILASENGFFKSTSEIIDEILYLGSVNIKNDLYSLRQLSLLLQDLDQLIIEDPQLIGIDLVMKDKLLVIGLFTNENTIAARNSSCTYNTSDDYSIGKTTPPAGFGCQEDPSIPELEYRFNSLRCYLRSYVPTECDGTNPTGVGYVYSVIHPNTIDSLYDVTSEPMSSIEDGFCEFLNNLPSGYSDDYILGYKKNSPMFTPCVPQNMNTIQEDVADLAEYFLDNYLDSEWRIHTVYLDYNRVLDGDHPLGWWDWYQSATYVFKKCTQYNQPGS